MLRRLEWWPDWKIALTLTVALRVFYSGIAAVLSFFLHPDSARVHSNALTENLSAPGSWYYALLGIWERFDTLWYLHIAQHDYDLPRAVIFYPLYPAAIRLVSWALPAPMAALLVSTVGAFFFFWGLLRLGREQLSVTGRLRMVLLVCVWPTSFVLFAGYAESLTLALIVWAVVFARSARWLPATACGVLAGLGRPTGVLVAIPLALLALRSRRLSAAVVLLTPAGLLSYWGWLRYSGRPSVVEAYRIYQGSTLAPPWASVWETLRLIVTQHEGLLAIKFGLVVLVAVLSLRSEVRLEDKLFAMAVILQMLMYTGRPLLGAARYLLPVYPAFVVLGGWAAMRSGKQFAIYLTAFGFVNLLWMWAFLNWDVRFV
jgi:Gpi18-like mannosyltransferase